MNLAAYLLALALPWVVRVLVGLGFATVSFASVSVAADALLDIALDKWSAMPSAVLAISTLSGIPQALGMVAGAYVARVAVWSAINGTKYVLGAK